MAMSIEKQQRISQQRREQILDSAMELFDQYGFHNTKISDITERAGISKGLFYHYFTSKEDIFTAIIDRVDAAIKECADHEDAIEAITLFARWLLSYPYHENRVPPMRVLFNARIQGEVQIPDDINPINEDFGRSYFGPIFERGQQQGYFRSGDPKVLGDHFWKYLVGSMSLMKAQRAGTVYQPDIDSLLSIYLSSDSQEH